MKKKTIVIASVVLSVVLVAGVLGTGVVLAASNSDSAPPIVQNLAEKLGVKESDVHDAFEEMREEKQQEMQEKFEERLDEAVKEGKITEEQKAEILEKHTAIQEKQAEIHELKQELKSWADENDIDLRDVMGKGFKGGRGGRGMGGPGGGCFGPGPAQ